MSTVVIEGQLTATGATSALPVSDSAIPSRNININISGTFVATISVERSFDNGATWHVVSKNAGGAYGKILAWLERSMTNQSFLLDGLEAKLGHR